MMAGMDLPVFVIRAQIASAVDVFIQQAAIERRQPQDYPDY